MNLLVAISCSLIHCPFFRPRPPSLLRSPKLLKRVENFRPSSTRLGRRAGSATVPCGCGRVSIAAPLQPCCSAVLHDSCLPLNGELDTSHTLEKLNKTVAMEVVVPTPTRLLKPSRHYLRTDKSNQNFHFSGMLQQWQ